METQTKNSLLKWDWEEFEEPYNTTTSSPTLSFCDLSELEKPEINNPLSKLEKSEINDPNFSPLNQDFFEFSTTIAPKKPNPTSDNCNIIFCGKLIPPKEADKKPKLLGSKPRSTPLGKERTPHQSSTTKPQQKLDNYIIFYENLIPPKEEDKKVKLSGLKPRNTPLQKVGTLHQSLVKYKKQWVYIGMGRSSGPPGVTELRDIKMRQRKMANARVEVGERNVTGGASGGSLVKVDGNGRDGTGKGQWSLLRTLGFRAHLSSVLTKASFGCLSTSAVS